jgi:hypothetical protein
MDEHWKQPACLDDLDPTFALDTHLSSIASIQAGEGGGSMPRSDPEFPKGVAKPAIRALASVGVTRLDQAARFTKAELLALHGMGPKAIRLIEAELRARGKSFKQGK